jgi:dTDP-4-dehydrorhamnose 3,5-epimerase
MIQTPTVTEGGTFVDQRGIMRFVNDFRFEDIKRFYFIKHTDIHIVRAWQGHQAEKKYFYPISGSFAIAWVKIDDFMEPSADLIPEYHILSASKSEVLSIPKGYANGLKALEPNSELMIFSDLDLEQSLMEKIRFPSDWWLDWNNIAKSHE